MKSYKEILEVLAQPAPGPVRISELPESRAHTLQAYVIGRCRSFLVDNFGKDWDLSRNLKQVYKLLVNRVSNLESGDSPYTLMDRFVTHLRPHAVNSPQAVLKNMRKKLRGRAPGKVPLDTLDPKWLFEIKQSLLASVMQYFDQVFEAWEERVSVKALLEAYKVRMESLKNDECPFALTHRFLTILRNIDYLDYRVSGEESIRAMRRRDKRVSRGIIQCGSPKSPRKHVKRDEEESNGVSKYVDTEIGRDCFFPSLLSDSQFEEIIEREMLEFSLEGKDEEGAPLVRLSTENEGAWAIYKLENDVYCRTFKFRPNAQQPHVPNQQMKRAVAGGAL